MTEKQVRSPGVEDTMTARHYFELGEQTLDMLNDLMQHTDVLGMDLLRRAIANIEELVRAELTNRSLPALDKTVYLDNIRIFGSLPLRLKIHSVDTAHSILIRAGVDPMRNVLLKPNTAIQFSREDFVFLLVSDGVTLQVAEVCE